MQQLPPWLHWLETCPSTNTWAKKTPKLHHGDVVFTRHQTAGRGQYQRSWYSPPGVLTASFVLEGLLPSKLPILSLATGLVVIDGVEDLLPALRGSLRIKWPNDVMACGRKLAGVLCEATSNTQQSRVVVGIGLNLKVDFTNSGIESAISLQEVSGEVPEELVLLERLRYHLIQIVEVIKSEQELTFLPKLRERDLLLHRSLTILSAGESFSGQGAGIDSGGRLLIRLEEGKIRAFVSGQVSYSLKP